MTDDMDARARVKRLEAENARLRESVQTEQEATDEWAIRAQRAESALAEESDRCDQLMRRLEALATPPPEGEYSIRCVICGVSVRPEDGGLCDEHKYDEQAHGDALADVYEALEQLQEGCENQEAEMFGNVGGAKELADKVRRHLTASGVPYVPEEVQSFPRHLRGMAAHAEGNTFDRVTLRAVADELERSLASAPAVPELKQERLWGICMAYEKGVCVGADGTDLPDPYPEGSNDSRAYRYGLQVGRENRENKIAAAPTDGRE